MTNQGRPPREPMRTGPAGTPTPTPAGASAQTPGLTDKVQQTASQVAGTVQETARPVVDMASQTAQQVAGQATQQVTSRLDMAVDYAAESLTGVAQALRQTGQHLREDASQPALGRFADTGAQQVERLGGYLRQHDATELMTEVETYARRNPLTFAGGAFTLGLLAARFFRATGQRPPSSPMRTGSAYGSTYRAAPPPPPRPATPPSAPRAGFDASNPPSYSSAAPAATTSPASQGRAPSAPGSAPSGAGAGISREAERLTPIPGSQSATGGTGSAGVAPSAGGTMSPGSAPGSERPGTGSPRQV